MDHLRIAQLLGSRGVHQIELPAKDGEYADVPTSLSPKLIEWLNRAGIEKLFSHQAESLTQFSAKNDLMILTGTGSGKSLCYTIPALETCLSEPAARCLFLFPTKALAQDQLGKLEQLIPGDEVLCSTYDGDTAKSNRSAIRKQANIALTNPDMVHIGMLPGHENWVRFLKNLRLIVVDEAHVYRGAFGGHVGWILRRLIRLCQWHGANPQIIASSATISNPVQHFEALTGRTPKLISADGAPQGAKQIIVVEAPDLEADSAPSPNYESAQLLAEAVSHHVKTMVFCRSRNGVELVLRMARQELEKNNGNTNWIDAYRGGYTPSERRGIERRLFSGDLRGLATTNAMELGVDVGGLDMVILNGYPGSRASFLQQSGRAGRAGREGLALMIAHPDPLEQFLARRINLLVAESEPSIASVKNPVIQAKQLRCAAYERAISTAEAREWGVEREIEELADAGELVHSAGMWFYPSHKAPAGGVNIRNADGESVQLWAGEHSLGEMERWRAMQNAHVGAVYLHRGETYQVHAIDWNQARAELGNFDGDYYTVASVQSVIESQAKLRGTKTDRFEASLEAVSVTTLVTGFRKVSLKGGSILSEEPLDPQSRTIDTVALRISLAWDSVPGLEIGSEKAVGGIHALEHVLGAVLPLVAGCDRRDIGTAWYMVAPDKLEPSVFLYDLAPGGLGLVEQGFQDLTQLLIRANELVSSCNCVDGCPLCIMSTLCECSNENLNKPMVLAILQALSLSLGQ